MTTLTIVFDTKYGQTQKIAEYAAELARDRGHTVQLVRPSAEDPATFGNALIVLSPVFAGKHMESIRRFAQSHHALLTARPSAFFSVSGSAASKFPAERARSMGLAEAFVASTSWRPRFIATLGGAIAYPRYNFFLRFMMKRITKKQGGPTDTSRTHELTDWVAVERAVDRLLTELDAKDAESKGASFAPQGGSSATAWG